MTQTFFERLVKAGNLKELQDLIVKIDDEEKYKKYFPAFIYSAKRIVKSHEEVLSLFKKGAYYRVAMSVIREFAPEFGGITTRPLLELYLKCVVDPYFGGLAAQDAVIESAESLLRVEDRSGIDRLDRVIKICDRMHPSPLQYKLRCEAAALIAQHFADADELIEHIIDLGPSPGTIMTLIRAYLDLPRELATPLTIETATTFLLLLTQILRGAEGLRSWIFNRITPLLDPGNCQASKGDLMVLMQFAWSHNFDINGNPRLETLVTDAIVPKIDSACDIGRLAGKCRYPASAHRVISRCLDDFAITNRWDAEIILAEIRSLAKGGKMNLDKVESAAQANGFTFDDRFREPGIAWERRKKDERSLAYAVYENENRIKHDPKTCGCLTCQFEKIGGESQLEAEDLLEALKNFYHEFFRKKGNNFENIYHAGRLEFEAVLEHYRLMGVVTERLAEILTIAYNHFQARYHDCNCLEHQLTRAEWQGFNKEALRAQYMKFEKAMLDEGQIMNTGIGLKPLFYEGELEGILADGDYPDKLREIAKNCVAHHKMKWLWASNFGLISGDDPDDMSDDIVYLKVPSDDMCDDGSIKI